MFRYPLLALTALSLLACSSSSPLPPFGGGGRDGDGGIRVEITRTSFGIPHIRAEDFESLGYGNGYVQAEDNLCLLLDEYLTNRGERARYFGPDGQHVIFPNGSVAINVDSDFFWRMMAREEAIAPLREALLPEARAGSRGYVRGFNRYLAELQRGEHPGRHASCRDAEWALPISEDDMFRRFLRLGVLASSSVFVSGIGTAQPPTPNLVPALPSSAQVLALAEADPDALRFFREPELGSNMYAIGQEASAEKSPLLFGNPHFPWEGPERLYITHQTIPGKLNMMGSALYGVPLALIGFNEHFAWSHTVSTAFRFTLYQLTLVPGRPTAYVYDGEIREMEAIPITIDVRQSDGSLTQQSRTLYRSHYGPMMGLAVSGVNILPWTPAIAFTLRDANAENDRLINHFFRWNLATSLEEFKQIQAETIAVPWVNTIATGPEGDAYYADVTTVPNVPDEMLTTCQTSVLSPAISVLVPGLPLLDGSRSACEWRTDADAPAPGIFGRGNLPVLEREDWVGNFNDSYWLTNPAEPITGFDRIIGAEETARSLRTRIGILKQLRRLDGSDGLEGTRWTREQLKASVLDSVIYSGELARDDVVATTCAGATGDLAAGCAALAGWDLSNNRDSRGGHLWREFWRDAVGSLGFYTTPFSVDDPVNTPRDIRANSPQVRSALENAVSRVANSGFAFDARLGEIQRSGITDREIEIFGGLGNTEGAFTIASAPRLSANGYPVRFGNSYIHVVSWEREGQGWTPITDGFVTYSQSTDPASPYFDDFTRAYSDKAWHRFHFTPAAIAEAAITEQVLSE
jgi:acyl-homoserine-lactone acylase